MKIGIRIDSLTFEKARRDITKLVPKVITDKNGQRRKVYVKLGIPIKKDMRVNKEPWDSSTEKAKELKISDFGTPEEVREMAQMPRRAQNRNEAIAILREIAKKGKLTSKFGIVASLSGKSIDKIVSEQSLHHSFDIQAHWQATANIDKLFSNAIEKWPFELNPNKANENLKDRKYLYAPMEYSRRIIPVKFTVKEYQQVGVEKRIYSLEAINVELE